MKYLKILAIALFAAVLFTGCDDDDETHTGDGNAVISLDSEAVVDVEFLNTNNVNLNIPIILREGTTPANYPIKIQFEMEGINGINPDDYVFFSSQDKVIFVQWYDDIISNTPILDLVVRGDADLMRKQQVAIYITDVQGAVLSEDDGDVTRILLNISKNF